MDCTWFGEICSCALNNSRNKFHQTTYKPYFRALYISSVIWCPDCFNYNYTATEHRMMWHDQLWAVVIYWATMFCLSFGAFFAIVFALRRNYLAFTRSVPFRFGEFLLTFRANCEEEFAGSAVRSAALLFRHIVESISPTRQFSTSLRNFYQLQVSTGPGKKMAPRLREFFRQGQAEEVSNSKNKILATWEPFFFAGPCTHRQTYWQTDTLQCPKILISSHTACPIPHILRVPCCL